MRFVINLKKKIKIVINNANKLDSTFHLSKFTLLAIFSDAVFLQQTISCMKRIDGAITLPLFTLFLGSTIRRCVIKTFYIACNLCRYFNVKLSYIYLNMINLFKIRFSSFFFVWKKVYIHFTSTTLFQINIS